MLIEKDADYERYIRLRAVGKKLNSTAVTGTLVAARLMKIPASECYMTTGAPIGVREKQAIDVVEWVLSKFTQPIESGNLSRTQANSIGKQVTRALLRVKSKNMILGDPEAHEEALRSGSFKG